MADKNCPTCGKRYKGLARYCGKCGVELVKDKTRCTAIRTALCRDAELEDDDLFCRYCGALTTFGKEQAEADHVPAVQTVD